MLCELVCLCFALQRRSLTAAPLIPKTDKMAKPSNQTNKQTIEKKSNANWTLFLRSINALRTGLFVLCTSAKVTYCCTTYSISRMGNLKGVIMSCEKGRIASRAFREIHSTVQSKVQCKIITDQNISERIGNNRNETKQIGVD